MEYIHNNAMGLIIIVMTIGLIGACYCSVMALYWTIQYDKEQSKKRRIARRQKKYNELKKKARLLLWIVDNTDENDYYKKCEEVGLCPKSSITETILGLHLDDSDLEEVKPWN